MKIAMLFNQRAGRGTSLGALRQMLARAGHEVVRVIEHRDQAAHLADPPAELVVAAGGDGTFAAAARALAGSSIPLALLPIGTANNMAFTLGVDGPEEEIAAGWHTARRQPLDLGTVRGDWGTRRFVEGMGGGLVEACMRTIQKRPVGSDEPPPRQVARALRRYLNTLARLQPRAWKFAVNGAWRSGEFLLVEVLNAAAVGPNLELDPRASTSDGQLTVVTAAEAHRDMLATYLADRLAGRDSLLQLPSEPATQVELVTPHPLHIDDALVDASMMPLSIEVEPAAVTVLMPPA